MHFRRGYTGRIDLQPCLFDWYEEGGTATGEYFLQDLYVAQKIHKHQPKRHVDIGSRVDGFVAHVASFREVEVFDIRLTSQNINNIVFKQADLMTLPESLLNYCDSLSCLHALEHFGLGRYGDPINPEGYIAGLINMSKIIISGGVFYLSVPVGIERVEFNAHRIFDPVKLVNLAASNGLLLKGFASVKPGEGLIESTHYAELRALNIALGIFIFIKK